MGKSNIGLHLNPNTKTIRVLVPTSIYNNLFEIAKFYGLSVNQIIRKSITIFGDKISLEKNSTEQRAAIKLVRNSECNNTVFRLGVNEYAKLTELAGELKVKNTGIIRLIIAELIDKEHKMVMGSNQPPAKPSMITFKISVSMKDKLTLFTRSRAITLVEFYRAAISNFTDDDKIIEYDDEIGKMKLVAACFSNREIDNLKVIAARRSTTASSFLRSAIAKEMTRLNIL